MNKVTFVELESKTWAYSYDWNSLMAVMNQDVEYPWYSDEPIGYCGEYNFATVYRIQRCWIISEVTPFKEGGCIGLEEIRDNKIDLGPSPSVEDIEQALVKIAANSAERERQQMAQLSASLLEPYWEDIPF